MSNLIVPDVAKPAIAKVLIATRTIAKVDLFQNNIVPDHNTNLATFAVATYGGYAQQSMTTPIVAGGLDGSNRAVITWDPVTFTQAGLPNNTIYGYYVTDDIGELLWVERFDSPVVFNVIGIFIILTPKFTEMSQFLNS